MKVYNLQCAHEHLFEGWFASEDDFQHQTQHGMLECPLCADKTIRKLPAAPRLNLLPGTDSSASRSGAPHQGDAASGHAASAQESVPAHESAAQAQAAWMKLARHVLANTEDVGENFADEARRMHSGESPERGIRGQATPEQTRELLEEGVPVLPLLLPDAIKETLQ